MHGGWFKITESVYSFKKNQVCGANIFLHWLRARDVTDVVGQEELCWRARDFITTANHPSLRLNSRRGLYKSRQKRTPDAVKLR